MYVIKHFSFPSWFPHFLWSVKVILIVNEETTLNWILVEITKLNSCKDSANKLLQGSKEMGGIDIQTLFSIFIFLAEQNKTIQLAKKWKKQQISRVTLKDSNYYLTATEPESSVNLAI